MLISSKKISQIKLAVALLRLRIIPKRKLGLFFLSIIMISTIATIMIGYVVGIQQKEFFVTDRDDVLVLFNQNSSTPVTGFIDERFVKPLESITGILSISPEIYAAGIKSDTEEPLIAHGVTSSFFDIHEITIISGNNPFTNSTTSVNEILVGANIAELMNLKINQTFLFNSALKSASNNFIVAGIFISNSPLDDELLIPFENSRALGWAPVGFITLIQVKFDVTQTSKNHITMFFESEFINSFHLIPDVVFENLEPSEIEVLVTGFNNQFIEKFTPETFMFTLNLTFGEYTITVHLKNEFKLFNFEFLSNQTYSQSIQLKLSPDKPYHDLNVQTSYLGKKLNDFNVTVLNSNSNKFITTKNSNGNHTVSFKLPANKSYKIINSIEGKSREIILFLDRPKNETFYLETGIFLNLTNSSTGAFIENATIDVLDFYSNKSLNPNIIVDDNQYLVSIFPTKARLLVQKGSFSRIKIIKVLKQNPSPLTMYLGVTNVTLTAVNTESNAINWTITQNSTFIAQKSQASQIKFEGESGKSYLITLNTTIQSNKYEIIPEMNFNKSISIKDNYELIFQVHNGTEINFIPIINAEVQIQIQGQNQSSDLITDFNGSVQFGISEANIFNITIRKDNFTVIREIKFLNNSITFLSIPLGKVRLVVHTLTKGIGPASNRSIEIFIVNFGAQYFSDLTPYLSDENGELDIFLPLTEDIKIINLFNSLFYHFNTPFSQVIEVSFIYEFTTEINIDIKDFNGIVIQNVEVTLRDDSDFRRNSLSDELGQINLTEIPPGTYKLIATFENLRRVLEIKVLTDPVAVNVTFFINIISLDAENYLQFKTFRNIQVENPSDFINTFFAKTLSIFIVALGSGVILTIVLSLLSLESVISFPIHQHWSEINILRLLGGSKFQISMLLSLKLSIYAFIAVIIGFIPTQLILIFITSIATSNLGGIIFTPVFDILAIFSIIGVIFTTTFVISFLYLTKNLK